MVEATDAAVEKKVVMVSADDAALADVAVERPRRDVFPAAWAAVSVSRLGLVVRLGTFIIRHQQRYLVVLL